MHYLLLLQYYIAQYGWNIFEFVFTIIVFIFLLKARKFIQLVVKLALGIFILCAFSIIINNEIVAGYLAEIAFLLLAITSIFYFIEDRKHGNV
ncbi:MAG TPA: hypothetical protein VMR41_00015 [Patescibacteria group bacterium]|nr:hypothetical protein [Patescibacteria group bacterium]